MEVITLVGQLFFNIGVLVLLFERAFCRQPNEYAYDAEELQKLIARTIGGTTFRQDERLNDFDKKFDKYDFRTDLMNQQYDYLYKLSNQLRDQMTAADEQIQALTKLNQVSEQQIKDLQAEIAALKNDNSTHMCAPPIWYNPDTIFGPAQSSSITSTPVVPPGFFEINTEWSDTPSDK